MATDWTKHSVWLYKNGEWVGLPEPALGGYTPEIYDVDASTTGRNQSGTMIRDRVSVKRKLNCTWHNIPASEAKTLLDLVTSVFFELKYLDPLTNTYLTKTFYVGDRSIPMYSKATPLGTIYSELSMNFIER